jgi:hypothetical protein
LKLGGWEKQGAGEAMYVALMILFVPVVVLLGWYGGHLTMPYAKAE